MLSAQKGPTAHGHTVRPAFASRQQSVCQTGQIKLQRARGWEGQRADSREAGAPACLPQVFPVWIQYRVCWTCWTYGFHWQAMRLLLQANTVMNLQKFWRKSYTELFLLQPSLVVWAHSSQSNHWLWLKWIFFFQENWKKCLLQVAVWSLSSVISSLYKLQNLQAEEQGVSFICLITEAMLYWHKWKINPSDSLLPSVAIILTVWTCLPWICTWTQQGDQRSILGFYSCWFFSLNHL